MAVAPRMLRHVSALAMLLSVATACGGDDAEPVTAGDGTTTSSSTLETSSSDAPDNDDAEPAVRAQLELRPVLQQLPPGGAPADDGSADGGCATPEGDWAIDRPVLSPQLLDGEEVACFELGPLEADGAIVESAAAAHHDLDQWSVTLALTGDGIGTFNEIAGACFDGAPTCPTRQLAIVIVIDRTVVSAPSVNAPTFEDGTIAISGGFTQVESEALAASLG